MIEQYLYDLQNRIEPEVEERLYSDWTAFLDGQVRRGFFSPRRARSAPPAVQWVNLSLNQTLDSFEYMALQQLSECSAALAQGAGSILNVRANFGIGILSSIFGAEVFRMDDALNTLPTTRPLPGGADAIRRLLDAGPPDLGTGFGGKCLAMGKYFVELFRDYPNIARHVHVYHPDLQGPMDIAELLWGSELFVALVDSPALVHALLGLIVETYIRFMRQWDAIVPPHDGCASHWGMLHKGCIMLRDDSAMNLSPEMFNDFIKPYDQRLLSELGGGAIHFCGRGDHYIHHVAGMEGVYAINVSQPEYNDMECIFRNTVDKGIALIGLQRETAESALSRGRELHGRVHCW